MDTLITTGLVSFVATIVGYLFGSRRSQAETDKIVLENVKGILDVYTSTIEDLKKEVGELKQEIKEYKECIDKLESELHTFKKQMKNKV